MVDARFNYMSKKCEQVGSCGLKYSYIFSKVITQPTILLSTSGVGSTALTVTPPRHSFRVSHAATSFEER